MFLHACVFPYSQFPIRLSLGRSPHGAGSLCAANGTNDFVESHTHDFSTTIHPTRLAGYPVSQVDRSATATRNDTYLLTVLCSVRRAHNTQHTTHFRLDPQLLRSDERSLSSISHRGSSILHSISFYSPSTTSLDKHHSTAFLSSPFHSHRTRRASGTCARPDSRVRAFVHFSPIKSGHVWGLSFGSGLLWYGMGVLSLVCLGSRSIVYIDGYPSFRTEGGKDG